jgi:hypothetical protein
MTPDEEDLERLERERWPMHHHQLLPGQDIKWFEQLWTDVLSLQKRYRLPVRTDWWQNDLQVEALAALAAWVQRYDSGEWDDPPGKLSLLFEIERIGALLRDGPDPFHPGRDRLAFEAFLSNLGGAS